MTSQQGAAATFVIATITGPICGYWGTGMMQLVVGAWWVRRRQRQEMSEAFVRLVQREDMRTYFLQVIDQTPDLQRTP